jgi:hypothetical protein
MRLKGSGLLFTGLGNIVTGSVSGIAFIAQGDIHGDLFNGVKI